MGGERACLSPASIPAFAPNVRFQHDKVRDRWIVQAPERMFVPDEIGVEILRRCDGLNSVEVIVEDLAQTFAAPREAILLDVIAMLQDLADKGVLRV